MRLLIIDKTTSDQAFLANKIQNLPKHELETMDISIQLSSPENFDPLLSVSDVVLLGSALDLQAHQISRHIRENSDCQVILLLEPEFYDSRSIRQAHYSGVRKVLSSDVSEVDLLQELIAIDAEYRREGKSPYGKITIVASPKGGSGSTSLAAGLAELCSINGKKTLLIDLDYETQDLCRALSLYSYVGKTSTSWIDVEQELTKTEFNNSLIKVDSNVNLLPAPANAKLGFLLMGTREGIEILERVVDLARFSHEHIIIDLGCSAGPGAIKLMNLADTILLLTGSCVLSITAVEIYINNLIASIGNADKVKLLYTGKKISLARIKQELEPALRLGEQAWTLPELIADESASEWAASGKTIYSAGSKQTKTTLNQIGVKLGLIEANQAIKGTTGIIDRLIGTDGQNTLPEPEKGGPKLNLIRKAVGS